MRRALKFLGSLAVATASCYLAYQAATFLVLSVPDLLLALFTDVAFDGFQSPHRLVIPPGMLLSASTRFPPEGSTLLYVLYHTGFLLSGAVLLWFGAARAGQARGWLRVFCVQTLFWASAVVVFDSAVLISWSRGPLGAALRARWPGGSGSLGVRLPLGLLIGGAALFALYVASRGLLDSDAANRRQRLLALARWLVLPAALAGLIINLSLWRFPSALVIGLTLGPALFLLAGLPAALARGRPAVPLRLSLRGATGLLLVFALALGSLLGYDKIVRLARRKDFSPQQSRYWQLQFENRVSTNPEREELATEADRRLEAVAARLGLPPPHSGLRAYLYASTATKAVMTGSDEPVTLVAGRSEIHHLLAPDGPVTDPRGDALLLLHVNWGKPGSDAVAQALARYALGQFQGVPLADYAARITREEGPYTLRDIFQLNSDYLSPLVSDALGGAWVESLVERRGRGILSVLYRQPLSAGAEEKFARALGSTWAELERDWQSYQLAHASQPAPEPARTPPLPFFQRGISFSHEVGGDWGYGSDRAQQELVRIRNLGANGVAVVPYAFTRAPRETRIFFFTDESDARVIRTLQAARQLGLHTMLKPQLWSHSFTGDIVFENEADFQRWFAQYRRWLLHYARLAELHQVDLLVIGTELPGVSHREAAWRALIRDLRRVYRGPLTYAAHWGSDFETLPFWDALDYLGVNMYYPLAGPGETPRPDSTRVRALVEKFAALAQKYQKPVLFTEVGFPSTAAAASEPWKEEDVPLDLELQRRCYATLFEAFYAQPWFAGLYWWKWPSHGGGVPYDPSYNPLGKPALEVLARWYGQPPQRPEIVVPPQTRYTHPRK